MKEGKKGKGFSRGRDERHRDYLGSIFLLKTCHQRMEMN